MAAIRHYYRRWIRTQLIEVLKMQLAAPGALLYSNAHRRRRIDSVMRRFTFMLALGVILTAGAEARMYQWTNPENGNVQLAGAPPAWYRSANPGPRVLVFDNGELVDDTAVPVSDEQRLALRSAALGSASAELTPTVDDSAEVLRDALVKAHEAGVDIAAVNAEVEAQQAARGAAAQTADNQISASDQADQLKALIEAFDQRRLDQARALLDLLPANDAQ